MSTQAKREVTVEEALKELRGMFPDSAVRVVAEDDPDDGLMCMVIVFTPEGGTLFRVGMSPAQLSLDECMAQVRKWKESQSS